jgi:hypothetical protein
LVLVEMQPDGVWARADAGIRERATAMTRRAAGEDLVPDLLDWRW